jgi:hypothetical protein
LLFGLGRVTANPCDGVGTQILACHDKGVIPDLELYKRLIMMLIKWDDR